MHRAKTILILLPAARSRFEAREFVIEPSIFIALRAILVAGHPVGVFLNLGTKASLFCSRDSPRPPEGKSFIESPRPKDRLISAFNDRCELRAMDPITGAALLNRGVSWSVSSSREGNTC